MVGKQEYYDSDKLKKITDKEFTFRLCDPRTKNITKEFRNLGIPFGFYGAYIVNKKSLYDLGCMIKEYFNSCCFRSKSSQRLQQIKSIEVLEHGTTVYFWCCNMNNFIVAGDTKKDTYKKLVTLLADILFNKDETYFNVFTSLRGNIHESNL